MHIDGGERCTPSMARRFDDSMTPPGEVQLAIPENILLRGHAAFLCYYRPPDYLAQMRMCRRERRTVIIDDSTTFGHRIPEYSGLRGHITFSYYNRHPE